MPYPRIEEWTDGDDVRRRSVFLRVARSLVTFSFNPCMTAPREGEKEREGERRREKREGRERVTLTVGFLCFYPHIYDR